MARTALWGAALAAAALGCAPEPASPAPPASIVLVVLDSLAAAHTDPYRSAADPRRATTPELAALAREGTLFEGARSQTAWTLPSVATLFTGLSQERHGLRFRADRLPPEPATLAEHLRGSGYRTAAVVQNPIVDAASGLDRGFDEYTLLDWGNDAAQRAVRLAAERWDARGGRPLFLFVHLAPPHMPYAPPAPFRGAFTPTASAVTGSVAECRYVHREGFHSDHPLVRALAARYDEHVLFADSLVGTLRARISSQDGYLCIVSDHGEAFMQHGAQGHNASVFEEMIRVPWIVRGPGVPAGGRVAGPVVLQDVAPTLVDLAGLPAFAVAAPVVDDAGRSHAARVRSDDPRDPGSKDARGTRRLLFSSRYSERTPLQLALLAGDEKLVVGADGRGALLYDLRLDPGETYDWSLERPERQAELLRIALERHADRRPRQPRASDEPPAALHELGYFDDR